jgi:hypothetical protein
MRIGHILFRAFDRARALASTIQFRGDARGLRRGFGSRIYGAHERGEESRGFFKSPRLRIKTRTGRCNDTRARERCEQDAMETRASPDFR